MSANRQPKNRINSYVRLMLFFNVFYSIGIKLYEKGYLNLYISESRPGKGKIGGIDSLSLFPMPSCFARWLSWEYMDADTRKRIRHICCYCYALGAICTYRLNMIRVLVFNYILLNRPVIPHKVPVISNRFCRFLAFGEISSIYCAMWFLAICRKNRGTTFSLITKRYDYFRNMRSVPRNLVITASALMVDDVRDLSLSHHNVHKTFCAVTSLTPYMDDSNYHVCNDKCLICATKRLGCYSRKGAPIIVREVQR